MSINVKDFQTEVLARSVSKPVLVDFWANWCSPCRVLSPILERLESQSQGAWELAKVDVDEHQDLAAAYGIASIPNVKLFHQKMVKAEFTGALPEFELLQWLKKHIPAKEEGKLELAAQLLREERYVDAERILRESLKNDSSSQQARSLLAIAILFRNPDEAAKLVADVDDPKSSDQVESVMTISRLMRLLPDGAALPSSPTKALYAKGIADLCARRFDAALSSFIQVIRDDRYYDDDGARRACIAIFKYLGEEHPTTLRFRREFSSALYV